METFRFKELNMQMNSISVTSLMEGNDIENELHENDVPLNHQENSIVEERKHNSHNAFVAHFNIDSTQNKFEELKLLNDSLRAQILILSENKIDRSYPDDQFRLQGYNMYIRDRCKGGGGPIAYFSTFIPSKRMKLPKTYKTQEAIAVECTIGRK